MLDALAEAYEQSGIAKGLKADIESNFSANQSSDQMRDVAEESDVLKGRQRARWTTQFRILSGRAFKNLYRDPVLLTAHYAASIIIAGEPSPMVTPRR